jgi:hypothetical protein
VVINNSFAASRIVLAVVRQAVSEAACLHIDAFGTNVRFCRRPGEVVTHPRVDIRWRGHVRMFQEDYQKPSEVSICRCLFNCY